MNLNDSEQVVATMRVVDRILDEAGIPPYTQLWSTNAALRAELDQLKDRLGLMNVELSKTRGDLVQAEMIVGTAASVEQIKRQLARMKLERTNFERSEHERFVRRWGNAGDSYQGSST